MLPAVICKLIAEYVIDYKKILVNGIDMNNINWRGLSRNPNAIDLLMSNQDKISWYNLSSNCADGAIALLTANPDKIYWDALSSNIADGAIDLLKANQDKIIWYELSHNPSIFTNDIAKYNTDIKSLQSLLYHIGIPM